jgi:hypothetical protein
VYVEVIAATDAVQCTSAFEHYNEVASSIALSAASQDTSVLLQVSPWLLQLSCFRRASEWFSRREEQGGRNLGDVIKVVKRRWSWGKDQ